MLTAFQNVADSLEALEADARTLTAASVAGRTAEESLALAQQQFAAGQSTSLAVLQAEQARRQTRIALSQAQAARFADTSALFQALGGGWWNRGDLDLAHFSATAAPGR